MLKVLPAKSRCCRRSKFRSTIQRKARPCPASGPRTCEGRASPRRNPRVVYVYPDHTGRLGFRFKYRRRQSAGSLNFVDAAQIERTDSLNITDALQQYVPGISINEVTGNPFQPDVQFRGFVASPVAGTPQGLAVYQNGVRINEAFGDTVNWDLIPTAAITLGHAS